MLVRLQYRYYGPMVAGKRREYRKVAGRTEERAGIAAANTCPLHYTWLAIKWLEGIHKLCVGVHHYCDTKRMTAQ